MRKIIAVLSVFKGWAPDLFGMLFNDRRMGL